MIFDMKKTGKNAPHCSCKGDLKGVLPTQDESVQRRVAAANFGPGNLAKGLK